MLYVATILKTAITVKAAAAHTCQLDCFGSISTEWWRNVSPCRARFRFLSCFLASLRALGLLLSCAFCYCLMIVSPRPIILDALHRIVTHRESLSREEARGVMGELLSGKCTDAQIAALLVGLHMKGEMVEEIVGFAEAIRAATTPINVHSNSLLDASGTGREALVDTCGTGGDAAGTFNISTVTAFVVAGAGVRVAKHGNRSSTPKVDGQNVSAKCGAADVMEALGVEIALPTGLISR